MAPLLLARPAGERGHLVLEVTAEFILAVFLYVFAVAILGFAYWTRPKND